VNATLDRLNEIALNRIFVNFTVVRAGRPDAKYNVSLQVDSKSRRFRVVRTIPETTNQDDDAALWFTFYNLGTGATQIIFELEPVQDSFSAILEPSYRYLGNATRLPPLTILREFVFPNAIIYTTKESNYERLFTPSDTLEFHAIFLNPTNKSVSGMFDIVFAGPGDIPPMSKRIILAAYSVADMNLSMNLSHATPGQYRAVLRQHCNNFTGRLAAVCEERNSNESRAYTFFVDEFGVPTWTRNMSMLNIAYPLMLSNEKGDYSDYQTALSDAASYGFNTAYIAVEYYQYNWLGSHQQTTINYWIPSGTSPDTHYSSPPKVLVERSGGLEQARNQIRNTVGMAQDRGLRVVGYMEPMFIYSPSSLGAECDGPLDTCWDRIIPYSCCRHETHVAHQNASSPSYVRFEDGAPRRVSFEEGRFGTTFSSSVGDIGVETSFCPAESSTRVEDANSIFTNDPDYPYHLAHEIRWLSENYNFDGLVLDDIGRAHLKFEVVPSDLTDASSIIRAVRPSQTYYCNNPNVCCGGDVQEALDSISTTLLDSRRQLRANSGEKALIISEYEPPADSGWNSLYGSSDVYSSDQNFIPKASFARYAYTNWNASFKPMKTDMRRSLLSGTLPVTNTPVMFYPYTQSQRPAWMRGVLTAIAWSNRVNMEVHYQNDLMNRADGSDQDTRFLFQHCHAMRNAASTSELPIFSTQVSQDLLYHSALPEFTSTGELLFCGTSDGGACSPQSPDEPYTVLYRLPGPQGEQARILHVINTRVLCPEERTKPYGTCLDPILFNNDVPADYYFKVRIPEGYNISRVVLVSPDTKTGLPESPRYTQYAYELPSVSLAGLREGEYITIKLSGDDRVTTYTVVYITLKPEWS